MACTCTRNTSGHAGAPQRCSPCFFSFELSLLCVPPLMCSYKLVALLYDVVPDILIQTGKVKNPCEWPTCFQL